MPDIQSRSLPVPPALLLADTGHHTNAVQDHIGAVTGSPQLTWLIENPLVCKILHQTDLSVFSAIGIHYSIKAYSDYYLPRSLKKALRHYQGIKFIFLQDEHRDGKLNVDTILDLGISVVFTLVSPEHYHLAYPQLIAANIRLITVLTGYVPDNLKDISLPPIQNRPIDIFYRSREFPYWLGALARERSELAEKVNHLAKTAGLHADISINEADRIYGKKWIERTCETKTVLGTESGASIWDADGRIEKQVKKRLSQDNTLTFEQISQEFLSQYENKIPYATASPRIFEAAALKTALVLFPGDYSGILKPNIHYIPLEKDFSNFNEVVAKIRDTAYLETMVQKTFEDVIESGLYHPEQLGNLVASTLLGMSSECTTSSMGIEQLTMTVAELKKQFKMRNYLACLWAETQFIVDKFVLLLTDPSYQGWGKVRLLSDGVKRYTAYVRVRWAKTR